MDNSRVNNSNSGKNSNIRDGNSKMHHHSRHFSLAEIHQILLNSLVSLQMANIKEKQLKAV
jgi:hypothetical protein